MSHVHRFYVEPGVSLEGEVALSEQEAHHGLHVVRLRVGEAVALFDGAGREAIGVVSRVDKRALRVAVEGVREHARPADSLTLYQAWLNQEKSLEAVIRRGTELGVSSFCFFRGAHSERKPRGAKKWERFAIESCKQCGRVWLPSFSQADDMSSALAEAGGTKLIATRDRPPVALREALNGADQASCFIGPEGDFSADEVERAVSAGAKPISLGPHTLRSEVAAATASILILYEMGLIGERA
jgi:16S rRNA (uracil1498-N3)-methyltransferase